MNDVANREQIMETREKEKKEERKKERKKASPPPPSPLYAFFHFVTSLPHSLVHFLELTD